MNDLLHNALNRVVDDAERRMTAHGITRTGPAKVSGRHLSDAANEPPPAAQRGSHRIAQHSITKVSTGCGMSDSTTLHCSCGYVSRPVHEYENNQCQVLASLERAHVSGGL